MRRILIPQQWFEPLIGKLDGNLKALEKAYAVRVAARGSEIFIDGDEEASQKAEQLIGRLVELLESGYAIAGGDVKTAASLFDQDPKVDLKHFFLSSKVIPSAKKTVYPKSFNQKQYIDAMEKQDLVFGVGPAGTGKTYLAMAMALAYLNARKVHRIILTRPAVEAGEKLGFLPGDLLEKVNPYLRPLYDALYDLVELDKASRFLEKGLIEIAPIAFMRGRTLNDSFVILDEAQNTTSEQMKMFLTRLGFSSKAIVTGDITQIDLPSGKISGLREAIDILSRVDDIAFVYFNETDVVRHPLVKKIIRAYEEYPGLERRKIRIEGGQSSESPASDNTEFGK
ncbi:MAG TPA: PhoH family protein [Acidobacteriota bacterium]|nr:PhoH family protein [Acidobacteriota bacterium]